MRNKILLGLLALFTMSMSAQNYSYFENDVRFYEGDNVVTLTHFGQYNIGEKWGFTDYATIEGNDEYTYGQLLIGGFYQLTNTFSVYVMAGKETGSNDIRMAYMGYYTTGDKLMAYAFYHKNIDESYDSEWYDLNVRYALVSKEKSSFYVGARYMRFYGVGVPITYRQSVSSSDSIFISYTHFYNNELPDGVSEWTPTLSINIQLM